MDTIPPTDMGRAPLPTWQLLHYVLLKFWTETPLIPHSKALHLVDYTRTLTDLPNSKYPTPEDHSIASRDIVSAWKSGGEVKEHEEKVSCLLRGGSLL